ncbi:hypothetical protein D5S17_03805 [Pseudonocardiaceae bacterium YIM PH 21723]|nr:hypothetical protein D5S17_03805 [Pseudonocardiaceae bacterium YIM PH 21723]
MSISERQFEAAQQYSWLRAAYYHQDMVETTLEKVAGDPNVVTPGLTDEVPLDYPDALLDGNNVVYVVPGTETSERAHLSRPGVEDPDQLLRYQPATEDFLAEVFA